VLVGGVDFSKLAFILQAANETAPAVVISYEKFIQTVVDFTIIAAVIFMVIKGINSMKKKEEEAKKVSSAPPAQEVLLTEIRDLLKK
jgi:large conductance mechanosensitive channel